MPNAYTGDQLVEQPGYLTFRGAGLESRLGVKGLLVRVGIDSTDGCWNAPMRLASGEFAYVTITDTKRCAHGMARRYDEFIPAVKRFGEQLPSPLLGQPTHLDPDFDQLTYGDQGQRGKRIHRC